jgi:hypothetical protein
MTIAAECWRQYTLAEKRLERSRAAHDPTAEMISQSQRDHWFAAWLRADPLDVSDQPARGSSTATRASVG